MQFLKIECWKIKLSFYQQPISYQRGKQSRDVEKVERLEAQRKERELKNQQALEVSTLFRKHLETFFFYLLQYHIHINVLVLVQFR